VVGGTVGTSILVGKLVGEVGAEGVGEPLEDFFPFFDDPLLPPSSFERFLKMLTGSSAPFARSILASKALSRKAVVLIVLLLF
jgi:hypothetical protein